MDSTIYLLNLESTGNSSCGSSVINYVGKNDKKRVSINFNRHNDVIVEQLLFEKFKAMECLNLDQIEDTNEIA